MTKKQLKIGTNFGLTSGNENSFNRAGCLLDCGNNEETACNVICSESNNSTVQTTYSNNVINQILYITPDEVKFYKLKADGEDGTEASKSISMSELSFDYQKVLAVGYKSQNDFNTAMHFARYMSLSQNWKKTINEHLSDMGAIDFWGTDGNTTYNLEFDKYGADINNYKYSGIFVFYSIGAGSGQGRMAYRVVREKKEVPIYLTFNKQDFQKGNLSGADIKISGIENVNSISNKGNLNNIGTGDIKVIPTKSEGYFKIKVLETGTPDDYIGLPSSGVTLTVSYSSGKVTGITSTNTTYVPNSTNSTVIIKNRPAVKLTFKKQDFNGNLIDGATIKVEGYIDSKGYNDVEKIVGRTNDTSKTLVRADVGTFKEITVYPKDDGNNIFHLTLTEVAPPSGYAGLPKSVTLTVTYNKDTGMVTGITSTNTTYVPNSSNSSTVKIKNRPVVKLYFKKEDLMGNGIGGAKISVTGVKGVDKIPQTSSFESHYAPAAGSFGDITVYPNDTINSNGVGTFTIHIKETAPTGYKGIEKDLTITYNQKTGQVISIGNDSSFSFSKTDNQIKMYNQPAIGKLTLLKTDSLTGAKLKGAKFKITLTNVKDVKGYSKNANGSFTTTSVTDDKGELILNDLVFNDKAGQITIKIEEISAPSAEGYHYKVIDPITFTINYKVVNGKAVYTLAGAPSEVSLNDKAEVTVSVKNKPLITLKGQVWLDGQQNEKKVETQNGLKENNEDKLKDVMVTLINAKDNTIAKDARGNQIKTYTDKDGKYEFKDIDKTKEGYKIKFTYDGINYIETKATNTNPYNPNYGKDSKADENTSERDTFNKTFMVVEKGNAHQPNSYKHWEQSITPLTYESIKGKDKEKDKAVLNARTYGKNPASSEHNFAMHAQTGTYTSETENIDCGLFKKEFDLSLGTLPDSARLELNGEEKTYNYGNLNEALMNLADAFQYKSSDQAEDKKINYNLYLYESDYNYRISDYKTDAEGGITNQVNPDDNKTDNYDDLKELEAYVTYKVFLNNQTPSHKAKVDEFVYYFDGYYTPSMIDGVTIEDSKKSGSGNNYDFTIDGNKITFTSNNKTPTITDRVEVNIEFKVRKDAYGNILLKKDYKNVGEITKYSTVEGGLIDMDSAPGNADVRYTSQGSPYAYNYYEDDTDEAPGLTIGPKEEARTVKGTVFEDSDKDGILNNQNKSVDGVIVQLIEIKTINNHNYEYIWQETRSGSNSVKTTDRNGYKGKVYTNSVKAGTGQFEFRDYIPGNYIIRYIYGDGSTYDVTDNVKKYNGQDYKSTINKSYSREVEWYNDAKNQYKSGQSIAVDNERRRIEVMKYSSTIDKTNGEALERRNKEDLQNTWMAAETLKIDVKIDADAAVVPNPVSTMSFSNMNFGLAQRPTTKLVLEKHITSLKITPNGTGVQPIVDARANISDILKGNTVKAEGVTDGLATIKSTRDERGRWQVATDVEELTQGANLEVQYTYVIKNEGETDYLDNDLVDAYLGNKDRTYDEYLNGLLGYLKTGMGNFKGSTHLYGEYLGEYYYTGKAGANDKVVPTRVEVLEEAINNDLAFTKETSGDDFKQTNTGAVSKNVLDTDGQSKEEKINTIVQNTSATKFLNPGETDSTKTITLTTVLSSSNGGELGADIPSYIAEIVKYSNPAGRRDIEATPANLSYVHSNDNTKTIANSNERDEFWGERITITKPTGEDKITPMQIAIISVTAVAIIGVGIVLIKKFALKK